jgi:hypothetical protein
VLNEGRPEIEVARLHRVFGRLGTDTPFTTSVSPSVTLALVISRRVWPSKGRGIYSNYTETPGKRPSGQWSGLAYNMETDVYYLKCKNPDCGDVVVVTRSLNTILKTYTLGISLSCEKCKHDDIYKFTDKVKAGTLRTKAVNLSLDPMNLR